MASPLFFVHFARALQDLAEEIGIKWEQEAGGCSTITKK